jgi:Membrane-bound lytic murein transglycosylase B
MKISVHVLLVFLFSLTSSVVKANDLTFDKWLTDFRKEAKLNGISQRILDAALGNAKPIKRVIELDRQPARIYHDF